MQALRAVAVALVVLFHAWPALLPGGFVGVDVFFVLSGFLITRMLLAEQARSGRISVTGFYARRARRLLPAATAVLLLVAVATLLLLPEIRWQQMAQELAASALYLENWQLWGQMTAYLGGDSPPGPLQHYWSLSIEEQFYLLWPLLLAAALGLGAAARPRRLTAGLAAALLVASLAWSIHRARIALPADYFNGAGRAWELAVGALLATLPGRPARGPLARLAAPVAAAALAGIVAAALLEVRRAAYPGAIALVPTLAAAAFIAADCERGPEPCPGALAGPWLARPFSRRPGRCSGSAASPTRSISGTGRSFSSPSRWRRGRRRRPAAQSRSPFRCCWRRRPGPWSRTPCATAGRCAAPDGRCSAAPPRSPPASSSPAS
ncbi:MAG: acyltransferase [Dongiaceae bacterium]